MKTLNSRIYTGWVRHRRFSPSEHQFKYKVFMLYLDLDEINSVFSISKLWSINRFNWQSFYRADFFKGKHSDLKQSVLTYISENSDIKAEQIARVCMLTNLRTLGFSMNPVTFYYAYDESGELLVIMPEITNTPWGERDQYLLSTNENPIHGLEPAVETTARSFRYKLAKKFHVSPFNPMDMEYDWRFSTPTDTTNTIHLANYKEQKKVFDATMVLEPVEITAKNIRHTLIQFPLITVKVASGIYINALRLWLKKVPFYRHPNKI
ncbi:DUF1365 domain-containing protein [Reinekea marina]|uniref:DUF1365 domain-containing protein n=1 Tax=Reinekea marina TaxID=1310421 RepID=A0ABV7WUV2_9GAMM|nr:DUF1365 domain-containing protein [Reinekea marina]MDN3649799.1 DUF1365 domain-containing protein [Reinekea marina]